MKQQDKARFADTITKIGNRLFMLTSLGDDSEFDEQMKKVEDLVKTYKRQRKITLTVKVQS